MIGKCTCDYNMMPNSPVVSDARSPTAWSHHQQVISAQLLACTLVPRSLSGRIRTFMVVKSCTGAQKVTQWLDQRPVDAQSLEKERHGLDSRLCVKVRWLHKHSF
jgi:hypothetical protein